MPRLDVSFVVTGASGGIGSAIVERLATVGDVVALDRVAKSWSSPRVHALVGDASEDADAERATAAANGLAPLCGWVNNAAIFEDLSLTTASTNEVTAAVAANLAMTVAGSRAAVRSFSAAGGGGAIVNVSSHQAQRPVRGALPYATAKAAIEGLTRAVAVDHGPHGIRCNAVSLGSISTARYDAHAAGNPDVAAEMARLHPLGRVGTVAEVAEVVAFLLSDASRFVNGAVVPVDGGRSALGLDPEAKEP